MAQHEAIDSVAVQLFGASVIWADAGGIKTRVVTAGEGPPVLLLHGITGQAESFARNVLPLSRRFRVFAIDLLGHGLTDKPTECAYTLRDFVDHVANVIDALAIRPAHVVGQSLGGWIGAWLAIDRAGHVRSLVLNTSAGLRVTSSDNDAATGRQWVREHGLRVAREPTFSNVRRQMDGLTAVPGLIPDEMVELRANVLRREDMQRAFPKIVDAIVPAAGTHEVDLSPERLRRISVPTLFIWGEKNRGTSWQEAKAASELVAGSSFHLVNDAGHWPQWEKADEFNRVVGDWLKRTGA